MVSKRGIYKFLLTLLLAFLTTQGLAGQDPRGKKGNVYKLKSGISINLFVNPTIHSGVVSKLPRNARWIVKLSEKKNYSSSTWRKVRWKGKTGWVQERHLVLDPAATKVATK